MAGTVACSVFSWTQCCRPAMQTDWLNALESALLITMLIFDQKFEQETRMNM